MQNHGYYDDDDLRDKYDLSSMRIVAKGRTVPRQRSRKNRL